MATPFLAMTKSLAPLSLRGSETTVAIQIIKIRHKGVFCNGAGDRIGFADLAKFADAKRRPLVRLFTAVRPAFSPVLISVPQAH